jgi:hypothetical protein
MIKNFVGVDNGLSGGIVVLNDDGHIYQKHTMPIKIVEGKRYYDIHAISELFKSLFLPGVELFVCLEASHVRPIQGKRASFMMGFGYGIIQGVLETLDIRYEIVKPQTWMKELDITKIEGGKGSIMFCARYFPGESFKVGKSKKDHDGLTDATAIALYCYRVNK